MRVCLGQWDLKQEELLSASGLTSLETRRVVARMCYLYNILHDMIDFPSLPVEGREIVYNSHSVNGISLVPIRF